MRSSRRRAGVTRALAAAALTLALAGSARACGICDDDAVASVYDHALVARETARGHFVVFLRPVGKGAAPAARAARVLRGLSTVDAGTVRANASPAAVAFGCAPERLADALAAAGERLRAGGIVLHTLRVVSTPMGGEARIR